MTLADSIFSATLFMFTVILKGAADDNFLPRVN